MDSFQDLQARVLRKSYTTAFGELTEEEKLLVAIWDLEAEVNNGGFSQYYFNSGGDNALFVVDALNRIGAHSTARIVQQANDYFGLDGPPSDIDRRQEIILAISDREEKPWEALDSAFYEYPDDLESLQKAYLRSRGIAV